MLSHKKEEMLKLTTSSEPCGKRPFWSFSRFTQKFPEAPVYCTEIAVKGLLKHYPALEGAESSL